MIDQIKRSGILLSLVGPSGVGKSSISKSLLEQEPELSLSISVTTRKARANEKEGEHYNFVTRQEFEKLIEREALLEYEQVHNELYGTRKDTLEDVTKQGKDLLLDIDVKGALKLKELFPRQSVNVFLLPPSKEALTERIKNRGSMESGELEQRLKTASFELEKLDQCVKQQKGVDYIVVNDSFEQSVEKTRAILHAERQSLLRYDNDDLAKLVML